MDLKLQASKDFSGPRGPVVLLIMDGIGVGRDAEGDMVRAAYTPTLDALRLQALYTELKAHGTAVGLPSDEDMGNSEVGHNAIGCGRVFDQGAQLVNRAIASGSLFAGETWKDLIAHCRRDDGTLHFIGLLSDGNVHSHIDHLAALLRQARKEEVKRLRVHILLDGRDVPPVSAHTYIEQLEAVLKELKDQGVDACIASGGGRMKTTMDRYEADWGMVERGWRTHVHGEGRGFASAMEAVKTLRSEHPDTGDQDLPPFVVVADGKPVGRITDGDSVVFFNFRGDRAIEISRAFEEDALDAFDRGQRPRVRYAGMMQYDGDLSIPKSYLVTPPAIDRTLGAYLAANGITQLAVSETQKYGHVTYFFNGNRSGYYDRGLEEYVEIPSDLAPFEERPWMKAAEITDRVVAAIRDQQQRFIRLNYPNGDMVGHTGVFRAVRLGVEAVDLSLARVLRAVRDAGGILVASADHGNADDMYERSKKTGQVAYAENGDPKPKTSHSLNPVPCFVYDPESQARLTLNPAARGAGIASLAATCMRLLGFEPPEDYEPSIVLPGGRG